MADYYSLISRAITALDNKSKEARCAIYDRARVALANQLREADPPFLVERERLALEDAINKVEAEWPIPERLQVEGNEQKSGSNVQQTQAADYPSDARIVIAFWIAFVCVTIIIWLIIWVFSWWWG